MHNVFFLLKTYYVVYSSCCRFTFLNGPLLQNKTALWDELLSSYVVSGKTPAMGDSLLEHIVSMETGTLKDQMAVLCSISNFHGWAAPCFQGKRSKLEVRYRQHLLFFPDMETNDDGSIKAKYLPASPRNLLMFFHLNESTRLFPTIISLLRYDREEIETLVFVPEGREDDGEKECRQPPVKRRRYTPRVISAQAQDLLEGMPEGVVNRAACDRSRFTRFCEELTAHGTIQWRKHSMEEDVLIMSDYCESTGKLKSLDYVHITASHHEPGTLLIKCDCKVYKFMQSTALKKLHLSLHENSVLDENFTCMHCKFYKQHLHAVRAEIHSQNTGSQLHTKVQQTLGLLNDPVVLLGQAYTNATTKLSVVGQETCQQVNINFTPKGCFVRCQSGMCQSIHDKGRKIPKNLSLEHLIKNSLGCDHLHTLYANAEKLREYFPQYFLGERASDEEDAEDAASEPDNNNPPGVEINQDDLEIKDSDSGAVYFDVGNSEWMSTSFSHHKPCEDRFDPHLAQKTAHRASFIPGELLSNQCWKGPVLKAVAKRPDGTYKDCICGQVWSDELAPAVRYAKVFTRQVRLHIRFCMSYLRFELTHIYVYPNTQKYVFSLASLFCVLKRIFMMQNVFYRARFGARFMTWSATTLNAPAQCCTQGRRTTFSSSPRPWVWQRRYSGILLAGLTMAECHSQNIVNRSLPYTKQPTLCQILRCQASCQTNHSLTISFVG